MITYNNQDTMLTNQVKEKPPKSRNTSSMDIIRTTSASTINLDCCSFSPEMVPMAPTISIMAASRCDSAVSEAEKVGNEGMVVSGVANTSLSSSNSSVLPITGSEATFSLVID